MRPLFEHYRGQRPVYALDLPGFGCSDRSERRYTPQLYIDAIVDLLRTVVGASADVIALSLGSEFAAAAAVEVADYIHSLTLISPSGLRQYSSQPPSDALYTAFSFPLWSQPFYDLLTSRRSIRFFLGRQFVDEPPQAFLDYAYATSHQPGARYAPLYFISGQLFNYTVTDSVYMRVPVPTLILYDRDPNVSFDRLAEVINQNANWHAERIAPSLGLPHWEQTDAVVTALETHWSRS
jgi:pimeloyl-ACP methyl ester carboxylesterase